MNHIHPKIQSAATCQDKQKNKKQELKTKFELMDRVNPKSKSAATEKDKRMKERSFYCEWGYTHLRFYRENDHITLFNYLLSAATNY